MDDQYYLEWCENRTSNYPNEFIGTEKYINLYKSVRMFYSMKLMKRYQYKRQMLQRLDSTNIRLTDVWLVQTSDWYKCFNLWNLKDQTV